MLDEHHLQASTSASSQRRFHPAKSRASRLGGGKVTSAAAQQARQRNLKQKFVSLLKKFKVTDPDLENEQGSLDQKLSGKAEEPKSEQDEGKSLRRSSFHWESRST